MVQLGLKFLPVKCKFLHTASAERNVLDKHFWVWSKPTQMKYLIPTLALLGSASNLSAQIFTSWVTVYDYSGNKLAEDYKSSSTPTTAQANATVASGGAKASYGNLGAYATSYHDCCGSGLYEAPVSGAQMEVFDLTFSSLNPLITEVSVGVKLELDGTFEVPEGGHASINVNVAFGGNAPVWSQAEVGAIWNPLGTGMTSATTEGQLVGYTGGSKSLLFNNPSVPTGVPVTLILILGASSTYSGASDFYNTLKMPTLGPVFDLPEGVTVNSPSLGIVDNHFVAVPEPWHYGCAFGLGLTGFAIARRRR